ncbi:MAG: MobQ family relaxase, partial [Pseudomonadota bacterium]
RSAHLYIASDVCVPFLEKRKTKTAMADYRLSAQAISRSKGQSSVASAAYRAGARLIDERTGEIHDYGRKGGVVHSEVMAPEATPEWMHDRAQLWNAVEAVERRKDAQLAREVQLSLPHELEPDQRQELVRSFVQEQFVDRGMIADVAIHAPSDQGDLRNHHAHIMLTMRELSGDGFGNKNRDWNSPDMLNEWREEWANHQNRALERHGHSSRVDHRSYEAQGVDREPTQHLGPVASDMERNGKASRIGDENRAIANDNADRALDHAESARLAAEIAREKWKFGEWAEYKRGEIENAQKLADLDLSQKHDRQLARLEKNLADIYGPAKATMKAEIETIAARMEAKGVRKLVRSVFGLEGRDKANLQKLESTLAGIERREDECRQALANRQQQDLKKEQERQEGNRRRLEKGIQTAREKRELSDWKPKSVKSRSSQKTRSGSASEKTQRIIEQERQNEPSIDDKKRATGKHSLDEKRGDLEKPWRRSQSTTRSEKPWRRTRGEGRARTRGPSPSGDGGKGGKK